MPPSDKSLFAFDLFVAENNPGLHSIGPSLWRNLFCSFCAKSTLDLWTVNYV